jgi:hypothetical protein
VVVLLLAFALLALLLGGSVVADQFKGSRAKQDSEAG